MSRERKQPSAAGNASRRRCYRLLLPLWATCCLLGCSTPDNPTPAEPRFDGVELTVLLSEGSPLEDAVTLRLTEWQARTGSTARIVRSGPADLAITPGDQVLSIPAIPIPDAILKDPGFAYNDFAPRYQKTLNVAGDHTVRAPLATDGVLVWYRRDLFEDEAHAAAFEKETGRRLEPPVTWKDYLQVAKFFQGRAPVRYGCAEAMDTSDDAVRNFFVHAAAYGKGAAWSSFAIDTETATPLLTAEPFREALVDWIELRRVSPAGDEAVTEPVSDAEARRLFREGQVALLLSRIPPTVDPSTKESSAIGKAIGVYSLPGSEKVTNPKTQSGETEEKLNSCVHLATTGWYLAFGKEEPVPAAAALLRFLCHAEETEFLVQAARHGIAPARTSLLDQPERFTGYRMTAGATQRWFGLLRNSLSAENWIADLRTSNARELNAALAQALQRALEGEVSTEEALEAANNEWKRIIGTNQKKFLEEYRQSLGLPALIP